MTLFLVPWPALRRGSLGAANRTAAGLGKQPAASRPAAEEADANPEEWLMTLFIDPAEEADANPEEWLMTLLDSSF